MALSLAAVARTLCLLESREFTAARNATARELKATDPAVAKEVGALRKPSPAAWMVNLLVAERRDRLDLLVRLGEQMRAAQEQLDRDALLQLGQERRDAIKALTQESAQIAAAHGGAPTAIVLAEVEQTLQAGTADADAAAAVTSGLLVRALRAVGFDPVELDGAVAVPGWTAGHAPGDDPRPAPVSITDARRRKLARQEAEALERTAGDAAAEAEVLARKAARLRHRYSSLEREAADLRESLAAAEEELATLDLDRRALVAAQERAEAGAEQSRARARDARSAADALDAAARPSHSPSSL